MEHQKHGTIMENLDPDVKAADDFYLYATGGWKRENPLRPEYARFGMFDKLAEDSRKKLRVLVENVEKDPESKVKGTDAQKVCDLYFLAGDMERRNREGAAPLLPFLDRIENFAVKENHARFEAESILSGVGAFINAGVGQDPDDSNKKMLTIGTAGTFLGDRDYYLVKSERNDTILAALKVYLLTIARLAGYADDDARRMSETIFEIDREIAEHQRTREENRNPEVHRNIRTYAQVKEQYPGFDWDTYFNTLGLPTDGPVNVSHPEFTTFIIEYVNSLPERKIKDYQIMTEISAATGVLSEDFENAEFEFSKVISGVSEQHPRWKKTLGAVNRALPDPVGKLYVARYFDNAKKEAMLTLVGNLKKALGKHIENLSWMRPATKKRALEKLDSMKVKIGFPDKWEDFSKIEVDPRKSLLENFRDMAIYWKHDAITRFKEPVDKTKWYMSPQTVNAYYSPLNNEICFPAAILQPPYFDIEADDALNYGSIGVVIGHEMTHAFDDSGRKFDADGNLNEWWEKEDAEKFKELSDKLVEQFDAVEIAPGVHANGKYTLGENIADQGGLRVALTAYLDSLTEEDRQREIDGFTPEQRFYLAYAAVWADNIRDEEVLKRNQTDPHSLGRNRVNVTLRNLGPFLKAFNIVEGDGMWRPESERVIIW